MPKEMIYSVFVRQIIKVAHRPTKNFSAPKRAHFGYIAIQL